MRQRLCTSTRAIAVATVLLGTGLTSASTEGFELGHLPLEIVSLIEMPGPDHERLEQEDQRRNAMGLPPRIAVPNEVSITPGTHGTWEYLADGRMMWRLRVLSPGAAHLNFGFGRYALPDSGELTIYNVDGSDTTNTMTVADNPAAGAYWTRIVQGDEVVIEVSVDQADRPALEQDVEITAINEGYHGFGASSFYRGSSESCNVDVVCALGDDWWDEIPSVGVYTVSGYWTCTGAMINNTNQDETPYFLTADHCGITTGNDQTVVVYWNHQNTYCRTPGSGDSGGNGNGNFNQVTGGSLWLVGNSTTDFTLIRLNSNPNASYQVTFAGWNRSSSAPTPGVGIHHPNTAEKRISSVDYSYSSGQYWGINWGQGRTYFGSSGSPLFNASHQIVGQLCCGNSFCTNDDDDYYGKSIYQSWNQLSPYLDPAGSSPSSLDTLNPYGSGGNGGVCCLSGTCYNVPEANCNSAGGTWYADMNCGEVNCSDPDPTGGCCTGTTCSVTTEANCTSGGGSYLGDESDCSGDPCAPDPTGACCVGVSCAVMTQANCYAASGTYQGDGTDCSGSPCGGSGTLDIRWKVIGTDLLSDGSSSYTVDVYVETPDQWRVDAVAGNSSQQKTVASTTSFYQDSYGGPTSQGVNPAFYPLAPDLRWDSRVTIGAIDSSGDPFAENALNDIGINWTTFEYGGDLSVGDGTWFVLPIDDQGDSQTFTDSACAERNGVLIARLTTMEHASEILFEALFQGRDGFNVTWQDIAAGTITYQGELDCNDNGNPDACDIANGSSYDANGNGIPDECESTCSGDADGDGDTDVDDVLAIINGFGTTYDVDDLLNTIADFGCSG
jgi:hypothetical protein